jgi:hypothetical protein
MAQRLSAQSRHVGRARVPGMLYDMGWYPAAIFDEDASTKVLGDVFALPPGDRLLAEIDAYEEGGPDYERVALEVAVIGGGRLQAWTYGVSVPPNSRIIPGGDLLAHWSAKGRRPIRS